MLDEHVHVRPMCAVTIKYKNTFKNVLWLKIWSHIKYHLKYSNFCWLIHKVYIIDNCKGKYIIHVLVVFIITWAYKETLQKKKNIGTLQIIHVSGKVIDIRYWLCLHDYWCVTKIYIDYHHMQSTVKQNDKSSTLRKLLLIERNRLIKQIIYWIHYIHLWFSYKFLCVCYI